MTATASDSSSNTEEGTNSNTGNNLHVSGLARSITDRQLEDLFSKCGKIVKAQVMVDPHTRTCLARQSLLACS